MGDETAIVETATGPVTVPKAAAFRNNVGDFVVVRIDVADLLNLNKDRLKHLPNDHEK